MNAKRVEPGKRPVPRHLSRDARRLWVRLTGEFAIEDEAGLALLQTACEAFDRMRSATAAITEHGLLIPDKWKQLKPNPAVVIERDARSGFLVAMKMLGLNPNVEASK